MSDNIRREKSHIRDVVSHSGGIKKWHWIRWNKRPEKCFQVFDGHLKIYTAIFQISLSHPGGLGFVLN